jgi:NAD(P)-dependent dehydrogenase (short-subunit alcohol dehydrogenase family)
MKQRVIFITGANGQLELAMARQFLTQNADDFVWWRRFFSLPARKRATLLAAI